MEEQPSGGAPPVVAVVVTRDPGPWFEAAVAALGAQDYPNLSILVIDAGSADDPTARVASAVPGAFVRRLPDPVAFAAGANEVLTVVEGASHFLFCHDDVAPDVDAVRALVEEAYRSNAGIVGPKIVEWDDPTRLLAVGLNVDKMATAAPVVERGELDQEQHDAVRDVFAVPGACLLVRADLFATLGGFDAVLGNAGADVDLCWRAQIAGARVVVAPAARVRHLEAARPDVRGGEPGVDIVARNRLRMVLVDYGRIHLIRVLPQAFVLMLAETLFAVVTGQGAHARGTVRAWTWNARQGRDIRARRRAVHASRTLSDGEVRRLQLRGSARLSGFVRSQVAGEGAGHTVASRGRDLAGSFRAGSLRLPMVVWTAIGAVLLVGSRHLLSGGIPAVGQLAPLPEGVTTLPRLFLSGWRTSGLGSAAPAPTALGLLGIGGALFLGAMGLLRTVLILGTVPLGAAGAYRLARPFGGRPVRLTATVVYLALPVPYDALARGRWGGLLAYAAAPFVLRRLLEATRLEPFDRPDRPRRLAELAPLAIVVALLAAFVPAALVVIVVVAAGLVLGSLLVGGVAGSARAVVAAVASALLAVVLLFPWSLDVLLPGAEWSSFTGVAPNRATAPSLGDLLRFDTGPIGGRIGWAFLVAAALPLLIGRSWRLAWGVRLWTVAIVCWAVAWTGGRGWLGIPTGAPEVLLAPAAAALALAVALGVVAFLVDLPGYRFGARQAVTLVAVAAVAAGSIPVLQAVGDGRWRLPAQDDAQLLSWMPAEVQRGDFRVLWVGSPEVLPLEGWQLQPGVAYATSRNGTPDVTDLWPAASDGPTRLIAQALEVARDGRTTRLGHLLAPMSVRYLALPVRATPGNHGAVSPLPADLTVALQGQLDLKEVPGDPSLKVYENVAWAPGRAALPPTSTVVDAVRSSRPELAGAVELGGSAPVLPRRSGPQSFTGPLESGQQVLFSEAFSSRWSLHVGGRSVAPATAFGWANFYSVPAAGQARLTYHTSPLRYVELLVELGVWVLVIGLAVAVRRRRPVDAGDPGEGMAEDVAGNGPGPGGPFAAVASAPPAADPDTQPPGAPDPSVRPEVTAETEAANSGIGR
jgi:GT2 family glycosyltransferase